MCPGRKQKRVQRFGEGGERERYFADDDKAGVHLAAWRTAFRLLSDADRVTFNALRADGWTGTVAELLAAVRLLAG